MADDTTTIPAVVPTDGAGAATATVVPPVPPVPPVSPDERPHIEVPRQVVRPRSPGTDRPRAINAHRADDLFTTIGAVLGSGALVWLLYYRVLPLSGGLGFLICWFVAFVGLLALLTSMANPRTAVVDRIAAVVIQAAAAVVGLALISTLAYIFWAGHTALFHTNFFTHDMSGVRPTSPLSQGGIYHALVGSLIEVGIAVAVSLPLGLATAVFMTEVGGKLARVVRTVIESMTALPDILAGLFVYTTVVVRLGEGRTGFAAALALSIMMLPIIARSADVVLRLVPGGLREAGLAMGASRWQTVRRVVLPTARPGLATALVLGVARGIGETAPLLIVSGASTFFNSDPFSNPMNSLPLFIYSSVTSGEPLYKARGFAACSVLLIVGLILFTITRLLARQRTGSR
jgi:phosphate transport system permease protein